MSQLKQGKRHSIKKKKEIQNMFTRIIIMIKGYVKVYLKTVK